MAVSLRLRLVLATSVAVLIALVLYKLLAAVYNRLPLGLIETDRLLRAALIFAGCYASYTLGANNVANTTGPFVTAGMLSPLMAALLGGTPGLISAPCAPAAAVLSVFAMELMNAGKIEPALIPAILGLTAMTSFTKPIRVLLEATRRLKAGSFDFRPHRLASEGGPYQ